MTARRRRGRVRDRVRVLTTQGTLPVLVCPMCAALVAADGAGQHQAVHAADAGRADR